MQQNFFLNQRNEEAGSIHAELCWKERGDFIGVVEDYVGEIRGFRLLLPFWRTDDISIFYNLVGLSTNNEL
jgi:hypothetical protein